MTPARTPPAEHILPAGSSEPLLPASTGVDAVTLRVTDLSAMAGYYRDALGLDELPVTARHQRPARSARARPARPPVPGEVTKTSD